MGLLDVICHTKFLIFFRAGKWTGGRGVERNNTTHLHKQQAHTSLSPSGINVDESFTLTINIIFMFIATNIFFIELDLLLTFGLNWLKSDFKG